VAFAGVRRRAPAASAAIQPLCATFFSASHLCTYLPLYPPVPPRAGSCLKDGDGEDGAAAACILAARSLLALASPPHRDVSLRLCILCGTANASRDAHLSARSRARARRAVDAIFLLTGMVPREGRGGRRAMTMALSQHRAIFIPAALPAAGYNTAARGLPFAWRQTVSS